MRGLAVVGVLGAIACAAACALDESGLASDGGADVGPDDVHSQDAQVDAPDAPADVADVVVEEAAPPACNPVAAFGNPTNLGNGVNSAASEASPTLTNDELTIFFQRSPDSTHASLMYAQRTSRTATFPNAQTVATISNGGTYDVSPFVANGMSALYFSSARQQTNRLDLFSATGNGQPDGWSNVQALTALNQTGASTYSPFIASTGEIWFASDRAGKGDLYTSPNTTTSPIAYVTLNTGQSELLPVLDAAALTVFFARDDSQKYLHVFAATRSTTNQVFVSPQQQTAFDVPSSSSAPGWLSPDGCRMYFLSDRPGGQGSVDLWMAARGS